MHPSPQAQQTQSSFCWGSPVRLEGTSPCAWSMGPSLLHGAEAGARGVSTHGGLCSASPSQHGLNCLGTAGITRKGLQPQRAPWSTSSDSSLPGDRDPAEVVPWECQAPSKAPGAAVLSRTLGMHPPPCTSQLAQQLPTGPSSWRIRPGMFGWRLLRAAAAFAIAGHSSWRWAKVLVFGWLLSASGWAWWDVKERGKEDGECESILNEDYTMQKICTGKLRSGAKCSQIPPGFPFITHRERKGQAGIALSHRSVSTRE